MDGGWVCLHRKICRSAVFQDAELLKLWVLCLALANHEDAWVPVDGNKLPVLVKRGQFITGRDALHAEFYPKKVGAKKLRSGPKKAPRTVWRWLKMLETLGNVTIDASSKYSLVTVVNYRTYNDKPVASVQVNGQQVSSTCPADDQQVSSTCPQTTTKNKKEQDPIPLPPSLAGTPPDFELTAAGLAQAWCFYCRRMNRSGLGPVDTEAQMTPQFEELLRLGYRPEVLRERITSKGRDRTEPFFKFVERIKKDIVPGSNGVSGGFQTAAEKIRASRAEDERENY